MAVTLTFDAYGCYQAMIDKLMEVANNIMKDFYQEAIYGLDAKGKADSKKIDAIIDTTTGYIEARCEFYANALMQSFGTGSRADTSLRSYWAEYKESRRFNPKRPWTQIVGRPRGSYIDIFGEKRSTWGGKAGINIEGESWTDKKTGETVLIEPVTPKYSIQNAENWLIRNAERRIDKRIEDELKQFFSTEARKYFKEVNI